MVGEATAIEDNLVDTCRLGALGDELADAGGRSNAAAPARGALAGLVRRRRRKGGARLVVDDLRDEVLVGTEDREAGPLGRAADVLCLLYTSDAADE